MYIAIPKKIRSDHAIARARRCFPCKLRSMVTLAATPRGAGLRFVHVSDYFAGQPDTRELVDAIEAAMTRPC